MTDTEDHAARDRRSAALAGAHFLNAIVFLFVGEALYRPFLSPLDLGGVAEHRTVYLVGVLVEWIASVPLVLMIPVLLFPIFARVSKRAAAAYLALRLLEVALLSVADVQKLRVIDFAGWPDPGAAEVQAMAALEGAAWIDSAGLIYNLVFTASALVLFGTLYAARMVPRLLAGWGLLATVVLMAGSVVFEFGLIPPAAGPIVWGPIALAEILLALWLIVRGLKIAP